eukprot:364015-Chlamydomonas_euryale.AAC.2
MANQPMAVTFHTCTSPLTWSATLRSRASTSRSRASIEACRPLSRASAPVCTPSRSPISCR